MKTKDIEINTWSLLTDLERGRYVAQLIERFKIFATDRAIMGLRDDSDSAHHFVMDELSLFVQIETGGCAKCGARLDRHWLKDGICNGCRNPHLIVTAVVENKEQKFRREAINDGLMHYTPPEEKSVLDEGLSFYKAKERTGLTTHISMYRPHMLGSFCTNRGILMYRDVQGVLHPAYDNLTLLDIEALDWKIMVDTGDHNEEAL